MDIQETTVELHHDCETKVFTVSVRDIGQVLAVLRRHLLLSWDQNRNNPDLDQRFIGSGAFKHWREKDGLHFTVDVGCWCAHDCCGHICGLEYVVSIVGSILIVVCRICRNY